MTILGEQFIGQRALKGSNGELFGIEAATGEKLQPGFGGATLEDADAACALAEAAFDHHRRPRVVDDVAAYRFRRRHDGNHRSGGRPAILDDDLLSEGRAGEHSDERR